MNSSILANLEINSMTNRRQSKSKGKIGLIFFIVISISLFAFSGHASEPRSIATPSTIKKMSGESSADFEKRKRRITYGTPENRQKCRDMQINVGLCKGGSSSSCFYNALYEAWCVGPGEDKSHAISLIPAVSREDYFDYRDGRWLTRKEYCEFLINEPVSRRGRPQRIDRINKTCGDLIRQPLR